MLRDAIDCIFLLVTNMKTTIIMIFLFIAITGDCSSDTPDETSEITTPKGI